MLDVSNYLDRIRIESHFLTISQVVEIVGKENSVFDPFSILISQNAEIGTGNVFYSNVIISASTTSRLTIGDRNVFHPGTTLEAADGEIQVGSDNVFGDGGFSARANRPGAQIKIGDSGRYKDGAKIFGKSYLGNGCQILGAVTAEDCYLSDGQSHLFPDPDERGAVLKGFGVARSITLGAGEVIQGDGMIQATDVLRQSSFHPKRS